MPNQYKTTISWCLAALLWGAGACQSVSPQDTESPTPSGPLPESAEEIVLSVVDGKDLTLADALEAFLSSHMGHGSLVQGEGAIRELVGRIVERQLFLQEAEALGVKDAEEIALAVKQHQMELAETLFWSREVAEQVEVSDQEVDDFYSRTDMALTVYYMEVEDKELADSLHKRILDGEDFDALAQIDSIHPSRDFGGLMGYVRRGDLERVIEDEIFALEEPGAMTSVVPTEKGFAFARFQEKTTNPNRPAREIAIPQIRSVLEERAKDKRTEEVEARILTDADVSVERDLITREAVLATTTPDTVVARAAGEELTLAELRGSLNLEAVAQNPDDKVVLDGLMEIADDWARGWALQDAIVRGGLTEDPSVVEPVDRYREDLQLGWLYRNFIYSEAEPNEEQVRAYYDENVLEGFTRPAEVRLAYIVVETEEEALTILKRVENGEDFGEMARRQSIDSISAAHGGRISWVREGQIIAEVEERAFALEVGGYDGPVPTEFGFFILNVLERKERELVPFEACQRIAETRLIKENQAAAHLFWAQRLHERAQVRVDEAGLQQAVAYLEREAEIEAAKLAEEEAARQAEADALQAEADAAAAEMIGPIPEDLPAPDETDETEETEGTDQTDQAGEPEQTDETEDMQADLGGSR